jgi:serine/threonine protein kinase
MNASDPDRETSTRLSSNGPGGVEENPSATAFYLPVAGPPPCATNPGRSAGVRRFEFLGPPRAEGELGWLAHYRVRRLIGEGGIGLVFLAEDTQLSRSVALKVIKPEMAGAPGVQSRFVREAQAMAAIKHDHIVTIYQVGRDNDTLLLAMEFLQGLSLQQWLERGRAPSVDLVLRIVREIAAGLAAAHQRGLIHRDIKPANIWLEAPSGRVKILDFGMARSERDDMHISQSGTVMGTPTYMAPEQARGATVGAGADLFSLGCVLYRLCAGRLPFQGASIMAVLTALSSETPRPPRELNTEVPPALDTLVMRLLAKRPEERPASAQAVVEDIKTIERELLAERRKAALLESAWSVDEAVSQEQRPANSPEEPSTARPEVRPGAGRRAWWIAAAVLGTAVAIGGFVSAPSRKNKVGFRADQPTSVWVRAEDTNRPVTTKGPDDPRPVQPEAGANRHRARDDRALVLDTSVAALPEKAQPIAAIESGLPAPGHGQPPAQPGPGDPLQPVDPRADASAMPGGASSAIQPGDDRRRRRAAEKDEPPAERAKATQERVDWSHIVDPDGDCKIDQDRASDRVTIGVPGTPHVLRAEMGRLNAPRLLCAVRGDFEVRVRVDGVFHPAGRATMREYAPYHSAGVLLWQDGENYLRLEIAADLHKGRVRPYVNYELRKNRALAVSRGIKIEDRSTYLRLERRGDEFVASFGPDGVHWTSLAPISAKLDDALKVGVAAINSSTKPLRAIVEDFRFVAGPSIRNEPRIK